MEENKIENGASAPVGIQKLATSHGEHHSHHGSHHDHACHGHHCGHMGHHFIKALIILFAVILLLCIGSAMGSRRESRYNNFQHYGNGGACGFRSQVPNQGSGGGRFYMMGNTQALPSQDTQYIEVRSNSVPTVVTTPSAPAATIPKPAPVK